MTLVAVGLGLGASQRWRHVGHRLAVAATVFLFAVGFLPIGNIIIFPLEQRFANVELPARNADIAGVIILGGFEDGWVSAKRPGLAINEAGERLTEGVRLARRWPTSKVIFTGAAGGVFSGRRDAAGPVGQFLADVGIAKERLVLEKRARNTQQNAQFLARMLAPKPEQKWILVTSAYHMPRAVGVFRLAGFNVTAANVDYRTQGRADLFRLFDKIHAGLQRTDLAAREWIGLVAYRMTGRTAQLYPAP